MPPKGVVQAGLNHIYPEFRQAGTSGIPPPYKHTYSTFPAALCSSVGLLVCVLLIEPFAALLTQRLLVKVKVFLF